MTRNEQKPKPLIELQQLRDENARLKTLLANHGIVWEEEPALLLETPPGTTELATTHLSTVDKVALFRRLFRGRPDVYPIRWESAKGKSGYSPACGNEWKPNVCNKPRIKCGDCSQRLLLPLTDKVIYDHLAGKHTVGVYPLLSDDSCYFLAADFDEAEWREDARAFIQSCHELNIPAILEISRSGNGAHVWIFFDEPVPAHNARQLGAALISHTCGRTRQLSLTSYDRFFPNQDTLPKGGFGNLIALPLQKQPREQGHSVVVDENFNPYLNQWDFLATIRPIHKTELEHAILRASDGRHPLDVEVVAEEDEGRPWQRIRSAVCRISGPLPESLKLVIANLIFIAKADLPQSLANRLIRLAAFQNPEFYKAQAMRLPVWNKPRIICCAEHFPRYIGLPRGCLDAALEMLHQNEIRPEIQDERVKGCQVISEFTGELRSDQQAAVSAVLRHEVGILCAPPAFGKTVIAAALIARRKVSTLILVHRTELLRQWQERLMTFLGLSKDTLGVIGGGKKNPTGKIDIAVIQSLSKYENLSELLDNYGQIIVDECHHVSAFSFEAILKEAKAMYVIGLTATPIRRDGHQPIIFMQCGPIRYSVARPGNSPVQMEVWPQSLLAPNISPESVIQDVFRILAEDVGRTRRIAQDILTAYQEGRKVLVLTERTKHVEMLREALGDVIEYCFVLHGRLSKKQRTDILTKLSELDDTTPRVLIATGRLIGEGFDHPPLDTLVLAMPISWKGTLRQYTGRLLRDHADKKDVRIYDYIELDHPQLARMWDKRQQGYRAMGYTIRS